jgi:hypothetical protein
LTRGNLRERVAIDETFGVYGGMRTSIALDTEGQPHVVTDVAGIGDGRPLMIYHRTGANAWTAGETLPLPDVQTDVMYGPSIKIDGNNRAWIAAHCYTVGDFDVSGQPMWTIDNVRASTALRWLGLKHFGPWGGWLNPVIALDSSYPNQVVVFTGDGVYSILRADNTVTAGGTLYIGQTGEQHYYAIGPRAGQPGIIHGCQSGAAPDQKPLNPASYMNSTMSDPVIWASITAYNQDNEQTHPGLAADLENPGTAYMACIWDRGLVLNVWNATLNGGAGRLVRPIDNLISLDATAAPYWRFNYPLAAAPGGGCWAAWSSGDQVKVAYVSAQGQAGETVTVAQGWTPNLCVDGHGNVHLAFASGDRMRYIKIRMSSGG